MRFSGIYRISSISHPDRFYIGSAVNLIARKSKHFNYLKRNIHDNPILQNHCNKYGIADLEFTILLFCKEDLLIEAEQDFMDYYNPALNICKKAGNTLGYKHTPENIEKFKNRIYTEEERRKNSESHKGQPSWNKGRKASEETREKQRLAKLGKKLPPFTQEHKDKIGRSNKGRTPWTKGKTNVFSEETIKLKRDKAFKTPIIQYDLQMNFIKEWSSLSEAARELHLITTLISKCLNNKRNHTGGFIWKRLKEVA